MDILSSIFQLICLFFEGIFYCLVLLFFLSEPTFTYVFKIAFLLILGFLIYASFRPTKQRWTALYIGDAVFGIGSLAVVCTGFVLQDVFVYCYGLIAAFYACALLFFIKFRHKKFLAPAEGTPEN